MHSLAQFTICLLLCLVWPLALWAAAPAASFNKQPHAAQLDFQKTATSNGICEGSYIEPARKPPDGLLSAEADKGSHAEDKATRLEGNVQIHTDAQSLNAEVVTLDDATGTYTASGGVTVRQPGLLLIGDKAQGNLDTGAASLDAASFLMHQSRLRGSAQNIERTDDARLLIKEGSLTRCEPGENTWAINSKRIEAFPAKGYGVARGVALRIKNLPVAYFPYLRFPIDDSRQSGFLLPPIGQGSDGGLDLVLPYYFNLAPNYDLTYALRSVWKRGFGHEAAFRHLSARTGNELGGAYLPDDDEPAQTNAPGARPGENRWLVYARHAGDYGNWSSQINYASVSDIDYLRDLGNPSIARTQRNGSIYTQALLRSGSLAWRRGNWNAGLHLRSFQDLSLLERNQYELLPEVALGWRRRLAGFDIDAEVQLAEFDRDTNADGSKPVTGQRRLLDLHLALPLRNAWGFFTPAVQVVHRRYQLDDTQGRKSPEITSALVSLDAGLAFERRAKLFGADALQTLEPRIFFLYADDDFQDDLPLFDTADTTPSHQQLFRSNRFSGYDRIGDANRASVGVTSTISSLATGRQLLTASLGMAVHFKDRQVLLDNRLANPQANTSPIFANVTANLTQRLVARLSYEWDTEDNRSNRGFASIKYRHPAGALVSFSYSLASDQVQRSSQLQQPRNEEESRLSFVWPLSFKPNKPGRWNLMGSWSYAWDSAGDNSRKGGNTIESLFGLEYNACCWRARLVMRRYLKDPQRHALTGIGSSEMYSFSRRADTGVFLEIQLKGLGSLGGRLDSLLEDSIVGYRP